MGGTVAEIIDRALTEGNVWPAMFRAGAAQAARQAILSALREAGYAVVPREPTKAMSRAGVRVNTFKNYHNGEPGCPGVASPDFPHDAFDESMTKVVDPKKLAAWEAAPKCLVASVTMSADAAYRAMIIAAEKQL